MTIHLVHAWNIIENAALGRRAGEEPGAVRGRFPPLDCADAGGIPVATVAIGGGLNAGLLAAQILSVADAGLARKLEAYRSSLHDAVVAKYARLVDLGSTDYLSQMTS